jgi:hypothetical protein
MVDFGVGSLRRPALPEKFRIKIRDGIEKAGVEFIAENGGGPGVRQRRWGQDRGLAPDRRRPAR